MIESDGQELTCRSLDAELVPRAGTIDRRCLGSVAEERDDYGTLEARQSFADAGDDRQRIDALAVVIVAIRGEQHLRFDLSEPVDDAVDAEIRRT